MKFLGLTKLVSTLYSSEHEAKVLLQRSIRIVDAIERVEATVEEGTSGCEVEVVQTTVQGRVVMHVGEWFQAMVEYGKTRSKNDSLATIEGRRREMVVRIRNGRGTKAAEMVEVVVE